MTTGAAATSRFVKESTAAATQNSIMQTKNTRRPSLSRSRRAPRIRRARRASSARIDDLREAVSTLEDTTRTAWQVFGGAHPLTESIEGALQNARAALRARETPPTSA
jgi:hypothetical protein